MKILALHGLGASGAMLKAQLAPFIKSFGSGYQFIFLDGAIPCGRGPAVPAWESGPFHSYATGFSPQEMREALHRIDMFIKKNGAFDGVLGFSLGSAMAVSFILDQQRKNPDAKPPFGFALLFSPIFVASPDDHCYRRLVGRILDDNHSDFRAEFPDGDFASLLDSENEHVFAEYLKVVLSMHSGVGNILPNTRLDFLSFEAQAGNVPRLLHPQIYKERVRIPIVHVSGKKDVYAMAEQSRVAEGLYTPSSTQLYRHDGGHDVPFKRSDVLTVVSMVKDAAEKGKQLQALYDF
ncbi:serine hydrolase FSH [Hypoxylon rubiginosum]|uniref:Serine hydrolase FSH n=1 Tax=Hypoxylon rubiginosum TaxID=110542 RepID=A0ACB9YMJ8_9PEZI|nr:serine hydrolase FSH [Hypoxylon rubiginosum]